MLHFLSLALSLFLLLLLSFSATSAAADSPPSFAAQRVIRGWSVEGLSANRWSGAVLVNDRNLWVSTAARGGPPTSIPTPNNGLSTFNLSAHAPHVLSQVAAAGPGRAWLRTGVQGQREHHYAYVDLDSGAVLVNVSHASFAPDDSWQVTVAVDASSHLFVASAPNVWVLDTDGKLLRSFSLGSQLPVGARLCVDVDSDGSLWVLGQAEPAKGSTFHLSRYAGHGAPLSSAVLNVSELLQFPDTAQMAVSDAGVGYVWEGVHDYVVRVDASTGVRGANIPSPLLRSVQGQLAVLAALNDSLLIAVLHQGLGGHRRGAGPPHRRARLHCQQQRAGAVRYVRTAAE